jgi:hypothetical protein
VTGAAARGVAGKAAGATPPASRARPWWTASASELPTITGSATAGLIAAYRPG